MAGPDIKEVATLLAAEIERLAGELLPAAVKRGRILQVGGLSGAKGDSMVVWLEGARGGWRDYATGESGDALDLVAAVLFRNERSPALAWAKQWLGIESAGPELAQRVQRARAVQAEARAAADAQQDGKRRAAKAIFLAKGLSHPLAWGDPVTLYLMCRGIDLRALPKLPGSLRYHQAVWHPETNAKHPAMVAAMHAPGGLGAVHITYLERAGETLRKLSTVKAAKRMLGGSGLVHLTRGADGRAWDHGSDDELDIGEGIESALSVAVRRPHVRCAAAAVAVNFARLELPARFRKVNLWEDNDGDNPQTAELYSTAYWQLRDEGRTVTRYRPAAAGTDFNDLAQQETAA